MMQISNFILKSRHGYNEDYICKYLPKSVARESIVNHQIWMKKTELLNDDREQKVVPELFEDPSWIDYDWAKNIDFTATRTYYVSSFCKAINASEMYRDYGECLYGYKNDRVADLISPVYIRKPRKKQVLTMIYRTQKECQLYLKLLHLMFYIMLMKQKMNCGFYLV